MNDFLSDEELDMFEQTHAMEGELAPPAGRRANPLVLPQPEPVPLYDLALAQDQVAPQQPSPEEQTGLLKKKLGPLPVWAWGLIGLGVGGTGYFAYKTMGGGKVTENSSDGDDDPKPSLGDLIGKALSPSDSGSSASGWEPSRSTFAKRLEEYYSRKGQSQHVKVWHDAEDAQKSGMKHLSPLINVQIKHGTVKLDQALTRFCRREGLNPVSHPDGSIGLYPHSSKRGKEWEEYIDALRDDGQQI